METVAGNTMVAGSMLTFTPSAPLRYGASYTLDLSQVRDVLERTLTGASSLTFRTEPGEMGGSVDPQFVHLSANQIVGITYLIENRTSTPLTLTSSEAAFLVNGEVVDTVPVPLTLIVLANSTASVASDVTVSQHIQDLAKAAEVDEVTVIRTFGEYTPSMAVTVSGGISISLRVLLTGSLTGPASVTEVLLDVPPDGKAVGWGADLRAHGFIKGTGNGPVSGIWLVDDQPIESFQVSLLAGTTQEVSTRLGLPTHSLGGHNVQLRITRPTQVDSNEMTYIVGSSDSGAQRTNVGKSWLNLRMDMARSNSDTVTAFGSTSSTGDALYAIADGKLADFRYAVGTAMTTCPSYSYSQEFPQHTAKAMSGSAPGSPAGSPTMSDVS